MNEILDLEQLKQGRNVEINLLTDPKITLPQKSDGGKPLMQSQIEEISQPSFLKKESLDNVSVVFSGNVPKNTKISKSFPYKKVLILMLLLGIITTIAGFGYFTIIKTDKKFYVANWQGLLSAEEKSQGIKTLSFDFKPDQVTEEVVSRSNDVEVTAKLSSKIQLISNFNNTSTFKIQKKNIDSIDVEIPDFYCKSDVKSCTELRNNVEETFRSKIEEQNKILENKEFKLTKLKNSKIKLQSDILGDRFLTLAS